MLWVNFSRRWFVIKNKNKKIPEYAVLIEKTFEALKTLGGSGKNDEINKKVAELLNLSDEVCSISHQNNSNLSEVNYRLAWARTLLKNYGAIENSARAVWCITTSFSDTISVNGNYIERNYKKRHEPEKPIDNTEELQMEDPDTEIPEEIRPWRKKLYHILINMNPYAFERLTQRLLRECGFDDVHVTKKSGDGGIDGTGKLKIGILSFQVAFQCKRYHGVVGSPEIRDFRGSLTTNIEKGIFITTGSFSKQAVEEASTPGKQRIELIDGEDFISKLAEFKIGLKEIKDYEVDENFFNTI